MHTHMLRAGISISILFFGGILLIAFGNTWIRMVGMGIVLSAVVLIHVIFRYIHRFDTERMEKERLVLLIKHLEEKIALYDVQKTEFVSIASHQLRTPLAIVRGYMELIKDGAYGHVPDTLRTAIDDVDVTNEELISLVEALLRMAQIEQDALEYHFAEHNYVQLITTAIQNILKSASSISLEEGTPIDVLMFDREKMMVVFTNVLENAVKYSKGEPVLVRLEKRGDYVVCTIIDKGCGFEPEEAHYIFEKFYRAQHARLDGVSGTGLGLYIAKKFVEGHGGAISAHSEGRGKGACFEISLPIR